LFLHENALEVYLFAMEKSCWIFPPPAMIERIYKEIPPAYRFSTNESS